MLIEFKLISYFQREFRLLRSFHVYWITKNMQTKTTRNIEILYFIMTTRRPSHRNRTCDEIGQLELRLVLTVSDSKDVRKLSVHSLKTIKHATIRLNIMQWSRGNQKFSRGELSEKSSFCPLQALINGNFHFACFNQTNAKVHWIHLRIFASEKRWGAHDAGVGTANSQNNPLWEWNGIRAILLFYECEKGGEILK